MEVAFVVVPKEAVKLEVAMVPVEVMFATETMFPEKMAFPCTDNGLPGVVVPKPA